MKLLLLPVKMSASKCSHWNKTTVDVTLDLLHDGNGPQEKNKKNLWNIFWQAQKDVQLFMKDYFDEQSSTANSFWSGVHVA